MAFVRSSGRNNLKYIFILIVISFCFVIFRHKYLITTKDYVYNKNKENIRPVNTIKTWNNDKIKLFWRRECGCTGLDDEAALILYALTLPPFSMSIDQLGTNKCVDKDENDVEKEQYCDRPHELIETLRILHESPVTMKNTHVIVLHYAYNGVCPISDNFNELFKPNQYVIARAMYETDGLPSDAVDRCNDKRIAEIWVPSEFNVKSFIQSGVNKKKVFKVPESIDSKFWDPNRWYKHIKNHPEDVTNLLTKYDLPKHGYIFLSVGKWEERKGLMLLIGAFLEAFDCSKDKNLVSLIIKTQTLSWATDTYEDLTTFETSKSSCSIRVITKRLTSSELALLYSISNAFVLPTKGEGWGLPTMEAMSMGLPVITTNFGGSLEFVNSRNSFLLDTEAMITTTMWQGNGRWAKPSKKHLIELMRHLQMNSDANTIGYEAYKTVRQNFTLFNTAKYIANRLSNIALSTRFNDK